MSRGELRVLDRHANVGVSEKLLKRAERHAPDGEPGSEGVPKVMEAQLGADA
jgi:hypothetical protein